MHHDVPYVLCYTKQRIFQSPSPCVCHTLMDSRQIWHPCLNLALGRHSFQSVLIVEGLRGKHQAVLVIGSESRAAETGCLHFSV